MPINTRCILKSDSISPSFHTKSSPRFMDNAPGSDVDKYHLIERKNHIHLLKLSIKNFIDFALSLSSGLDEEEASLYQLFVVLEQVGWR